MTTSAPPPVHVLGVHAGRVPPGTESLLGEARVVAGGARVLADLAPAGAEHVALGADLARSLDALAGADGPVCVLASGDPGFFGVVRALGERLGHERLCVHPAPSCVAVAFARLGMPWDDAIVVSAHARDPRPALHVALRHPKVAVLTAPANGPQWFAARLAGHGRRLVVAERLGQPHERIHTGTPEELAAGDFADPNVLLVLAEERADNGAARTWPPRTPARWALPETAFSHRAGMITKSEVRAAALARLGPGLGDLVWDVGCGSGSVGVECARLGAAAIALDCDADAVERTAENARAHRVPLRLVRGRAPEALAQLPDPDAVFVGGGGEDLGAILDACATRATRVTVAVLALLERAGPAIARLESHGLEVEATMIQASRLRPLAGGHRLAAENPVILVSGARP
jgi:precorrin-6B C5,15-methyltransferase / cobalt-precorrin-6B C5,C15-methyltransferase